MEDSKLVAEFLAAVLTGGGTYAIAHYLFEWLADFGVVLSSRSKRLCVLPVCAVVATAALGLQVALKINSLTPDSIFVALAAGFTASQMFHVRELAA